MRLLLVFFILINSNVISQLEYYEKNTWFSFVWRHDFNNNLQLTSDIGYRLYDNFLGLRRQDLFRIMVEKKFNQHQFGTGLAFFQTVKKGTNSFDPESRLFFNYIFQKNVKAFIYNIRFRNEFRYFNNNSVLDNRTRLMFSIDFDKNIKWFRPRVSAEGFYTITQSNNYEQRYSIGNHFYNTSKLRFFVFYTLQLQSKLSANNSPIEQHIIGFQLILNTFSKNENKNK